MNGKLGMVFFSYSKKHVSNVYNYILNQEAHHHKNSFEQEYVELLKINEVEYEEKYLFDPFES